MLKNLLLASTLFLSSLSLFAQPEETEFTVKLLVYNSETDEYDYSPLEFKPFFSEVSTNSAGEYTVANFMNSTYPMYMTFGDTYTEEGTQYFDITDIWPVDRFGGMLFFLTPRGSDMNGKIYDATDTLIKCNGIALYNGDVKKAGQVKADGSKVVELLLLGADADKKDHYWSVSFPISGPTSGIAAVQAAQGSAPVEYYSILGVKVENPTSGLYICRQGNKTSKVLLK